MDVSAVEIIHLLCKLADSENLKVTSNEKSRFSVEELISTHPQSKQSEVKNTCVIESKLQAGVNDAIYCGNESKGIHPQSKESQVENTCVIEAIAQGEFIDTIGSGNESKGIHPQSKQSQVKNTCVNEVKAEGEVVDAIDCGNESKVAERENYSIALNQNNTGFQSHLAGRFLDFMLTGFRAAFSRTWNYVFGHYRMSVNVRLEPVSSVLPALPPVEQNTLTQRIRRISEENSVTTYDDLAALIEQDSSLVRRLIVRQLVEYIDVDLSMPITRGS